MRRQWQDLSPAYRRRLERSGITRSAYESGVSLSAARGHSKTPERPSRAARNPERYKEYLGKRNRKTVTRQRFNAEVATIGDGSLDPDLWWDEFGVRLATDWTDLHRAAREAYSISETTPAAYYELQNLRDDEGYTLPVMALWYHLKKVE